ncbi:MAG: hypothetical protein RR034_03290 [Bacteroidales bacterium]
MKTQILFPYKCKKIGWFIFIPAIIIGMLTLCLTNFPEVSLKQLYQILFPNATTENCLFSSQFGFGSGDIIETFIGILILVGGTLVGFSKNRQEDEFIEKLRFESLVLAIYVNNIILILCLIFIWGLNFLSVMLYNMFTILIFFIVCFYIKLYLNKKSLKNDVKPHSENEFLNQKN